MEPGKCEHISLVQVFLLQQVWECLILSLSSTTLIPGRDFTAQVCQHMPSALAVLAAVPCNRLIEWFRLQPLLINFLHAIDTIYLL